MNRSWYAMTLLSTGVVPDATKLCVYLSNIICGGYVL
jgi:hypothetical protein